MMDASVAPLKHDFVRLGGRDAQVYISAEHEKCSHGMASPGPALVGGKSSVGKQQSSRNVSSSSWSFGSARRFVYSESKVPGPGTYD